jgi:hypothetical protein
MIEQDFHILLRKPQWKVECGNVRMSTASHGTVGRLLLSVTTAFKAPPTTKTFQKINKTPVQTLQKPFQSCKPCVFSNNRFLCSNITTNNVLYWTCFARQNPPFPNCRHRISNRRPARRLLLRRRRRPRAQRLLSMQLPSARLGPPSMKSEAKP